MRFTTGAERLFAALSAVAEPLLAPPGTQRGRCALRQSLKYVLEASAALRLSVRRPLVAAGELVSAGTRSRDSVG
jgi:hypothetical protein